MNAGLALAAVAAAVLALAAVVDVRARSVPDWLSLPSLAGGLASRAALHGLLGPGGLVLAAVGALVAAAAGAALAVWGRAEWGDVKLLAAVGAFFSFPAVAFALVAISLCGAMQSLAALAAARLLRAPRPDGIPYGVAIAAGSCLAAVAMLRGWWSEP